MTKASLDLAVTKRMLEAVLNENKFSGGVYRIGHIWLAARHSLPFDPQVELMIQRS